VPELESVIPAAKLIGDRMNRLAGFVLRSITVAFLLVAPKLCLGQTQLVPVKVAVPASFRSSPFDRDRYLQVPRGFQIRVVSRIPAARFLASTPEGGLLASQPSRGKIWWISLKSPDTKPSLEVSRRNPEMSDLDILKRPEYIHVALNYLPIYGTILGAFALAISLALRSRAAQIMALILTLITGVSSHPVFVSGQQAYKTIRSMSDDAGADALDEHMDRAERTIWAFYFMAALALAGLLVPIRWPKAGLPLAAVTLAVTVICAGVAIYIALQGYRIRHNEFRSSETLTPYSEKTTNFVECTANLPPSDDG
jgi:hypothetical protein